MWCDPDDCYDVLGVDRSATKSDVKRKYFALSRTHHPDKLSPDARDDEEAKKEATREFARIARAYEVLSDDRRRKDYDYALKNPEDKGMCLFLFAFLHYLSMWCTWNSYMCLQKRYVYSRSLTRLKF